jgi:hypothetical protein
MGSGLALQERKEKKREDQVMHQYNGGDDTTLPRLWIGRAGGARGGRRLAAATCSPWPHELRCFVHCLLLSDGRDQDPDRREELLAGSPLSIRSLAPLFLSLSLSPLNDGPRAALAASPSTAFSLPSRWLGWSAGVWTRRHVFRGRTQRSRGLCCPPVQGENR